MRSYIDFETSLDIEITRETAFFLAYDLDQTAGQEVFMLHAVPSITESVHLQQTLKKTVKTYWPMSNQLLSSGNDSLDTNLIFPHDSLINQPLTRVDIEKSFPGHLLKLELFGDALRQQAQKQSQMTEHELLIFNSEQQDLKSKAVMDSAEQAMDSAEQAMDGAEQAMDGLNQAMKDLSESIRRQENLDFSADDCLSVILKTACMWEVQLAAIALGTLLLLAFNGAGAVALGVGLIAVGVTGCAVSFFSPNADDASDRSECGSSLSVEI
ncbi:MAG: hypothetical protein P1U36_03740 [Legionellaceae bacterium]|nr:hypothetical protein [Legionellaceae bacterium]